MSIKWETDNVTELLQETANAKSAQKPHFMGTIVLTKGAEEEWEIADGQQRLATTAIIFCAIRDMLLKLDQEKRALVYENDLLFGRDDDGEPVARLRLNADDNNFFYNTILLRPPERPQQEPTFSSHGRLATAYTTARGFFETIKEQTGKGFLDELKLWKKFLENNSKVLLLKVSDSRLAFKMFETLNDRGVKTSEVDLVKNHLFDQADARRDEVRHAWSSMRAVIESVREDDDDLVLEYLRCACCVLYGIVRQKEIFDKISEKSKGPTSAVRMACELEEMANDYAALFNPEHPKWGADIQQHVKTLLDLDVKQMRPLLLAIGAHFSKAQAAVAFRMMISWAVRLTVAGGTKAGRLDTFYANLAHKIYDGEIKNYEQLLGASDSIPSDAVFEAGFSDVRVKVGSTARYYLRRLEETARGHRQPAWTPSQDTDAVNLEHVMPKTVCDEWSHVTQQDVETHANRLGNLALIQASENVLSDRAPFGTKKPILERCPFLLTEMIGKQFAEWNKGTIEERQKMLAKFAAKTWPIKP